jgi:hypothetical protein
VGLKTGLRGSIIAWRALGEVLNHAMSIKLDQRSWFRPVRGPFSFGETGCRNGEMNIAGVTIAGASIGLSVRLKATAAPIADGQRHTVGCASKPVQKAGAIEASDKLPCTPK